MSDDQFLIMLLLLIIGITWALVSNPLLCELVNTVFCIIDPHAICYFAQNGR
jgi:hypothetical protein